jgi:hypothetical protein
MSSGSEDESRHSRADQEKWGLYFVKLFYSRVPIIRGNVYRWNAG